MDIIDIILGAKLAAGGGGGSSSFIPSFGTLATISLGTSWSGNDPYTSTVTVTGYTVTEQTMISVLPSTAVLEQMLSDGTTNIYITNNNGTLTATALGAAPTQATTLNVLCTESDQAADLANLPAIVGDGVIETLQAADLTDAVNQLVSQKAPVIINTASGDVASFADGADRMPIRKIVGTIVPQQAAGTPSPDNPLPISGWTGANVTRTGKNMFNPQVILDAGGSYSEGVYSATQSQMQSVDFSYLKFKPNTQYYFYAYGKSNGTNTNHAQRIQINYTDGTTSYVSVLFCGITDYSEKSGTSTANKSIASIKFSAYGVTDSSEFTKFMICEASAGTDYEAFKGITTLPINWQSSAGTIYGGSFTLNEDGSADVISDRGIVTYDGSEAWSAGTTSGYPTFQIRRGSIPAAQFISNMLTWVKSLNSVPNTAYYGATYFNVYMPQYSDLESFKAMLQTTPMQVVYMLTTPQTYHFSDIGKLYTYLGANNVWIDTGAITECDYPADTKTYVDNGGGGAVADVQINGTSIVSSGVANIPIATGVQFGTIKAVDNLGLYMSSDGSLRLTDPTDLSIKLGNNSYYAIKTSKQHQSTFYGLAKAAGDTTQSASANAVGTYTEEAKNAIRAMLGVTDANGGMNIVTLTGTTITQIGADNTMYKCGELEELTFTAPTNGITAIRFTSGTTPTVASFPNVTWLGDFDPDHLLANTTYEINILDGVGVAGWA